MSDDLTPVTVTRLEVGTCDGETIQAELLEPENPIALAVVCHPHPLYGGSMDNNVVRSIVKGFRESDVAVARFNFRGVGQSTGEHGDGIAEQLDVHAVVNHLHNCHPHLPVGLCGYSFGGDVCLSVDHPAVTSWFVVAPPLRLLPIESMVALADERPKQLIVGRHDQFIDWKLVELFANDEQANWSTVTLEDVDHFFATGLGSVTETARNLFSRPRD